MCYNFIKFMLLTIWVISITEIGEGNGNPLQYSFLENSMDRGVL